MGVSFKKSSNTVKITRNYSFEGIVALFVGLGFLGMILQRWSEDSPLSSVHSLFLVVGAVVAVVGALMIGTYQTLEFRPKSKEVFYATSVFFFGGYEKLYPADKIETIIYHRITVQHTERGRAPWTTYEGNIVARVRGSQRVDLFKGRETSGCREAVQEACEAMEIEFDRQVDTREERHGALS